MNSNLLFFIQKKLFSFFISFWVIVTLTFFLMKIVPGDPLTQDKELSEEVYSQLYAFYGLDKPLITQYVHYIFNILSFNLGASYVHSGLKVSEVIVNAFPVSAYLGFQSLTIALTLGVCFGMMTALRKGTCLDQMTGLVVILLLSTPSFILAAFLQYIFGVKCGLFPIARWETMAHTWLPSISLASMPTVFLIKLIRANMLETMKQDYILFAKSKGLSHSSVIFKHALKNTLIPLLGYFGKMSANILVGSFIIEEIFCIPGLGYWFVSSISNRDYPLIMGLTIFYSFLLLGILLIADILHALLDSRLYRRQEAY